MSHEAEPGIFLAAEEGRAVTREAARTVLVKTAHPLVDVTWSRYEPGERGPPPHVHERHVDAFVVLGGELRFELGSGGEGAVDAPEGTLVGVPPGVVHTFGNEGAETATFLNLHAPSCGFVESLRRSAVGFDGADPPEGGGRDPRAVHVCPAGGGDELRRGEAVNRILFELPELSVLTIECGPGFAVAPHVHDDHLDAFLVLAGEVSLAVGGREELAGAGAWAAAPPGALHGLRHAGGGRALLLNVHAPDAGFAESIRRRSGS